MEMLGNIFKFDKIKILKYNYYVRKFYANQILQFSYYKVNTLSRLYFLYSLFFNFNKAFFGIIVLYESVL